MGNGLDYSKVPYLNVDDIEREEPFVLPMDMDVLSLIIGPRSTVSKHVREAVQVTQHAYWMREETSAFANRLPDIAFQVEPTNLGAKIIHDVSKFALEKQVRETRGLIATAPRMDIINGDLRHILPHYLGLKGIWAIDQYLGEVLPVHGISHDGISQKVYDRMPFKFQRGLGDILAPTG